ncbi:MAG TPA: Wzz/FepE/Etk N-terminal domain-containing protein [Candidatus Sulfotelmatobacter sp.]|nr:Wzz/FepE/Etk N-terminal domain-containing protein [Candidatus Sulfotelmatobacter sp.]
MNSPRPADHHAPTITLVDIYFVLFRRKWLILFFAALGLVAGGVFYFFKQPPYQSAAELLIKYVLDQRYSNPTESGSQVSQVTDLNPNVFNNEIHILMSPDACQEVVTNVGAEKILAKVGGGSDPGAAASVVHNGLMVTPGKDSTTLAITFSHPDPSVVTPVLTSIIDVYLQRHKAIHDIGLSDDSLMEQMAQLGQQIQLTDDELRVAMTNAGIIDIAEAKKSYADEIASIKHDIFQAEIQLSEYQATITDLSGQNAAAKATNDVSTNQIPNEIVSRYDTVCGQLEFYQKKLNDFILVQGYSDENKLVKEKHDQIADVTKVKKQLEDQYPGLAGMVVPTLNGGGTSASTSTDDGDAAKAASLPIRIQALKQHLLQLQTEVATLGEAEPKINQLLLKKKIQENSYTGMEEAQQRQLIDEALGPGRNSNIPITVHPSAPYRDFIRFYRNIAMLVFGTFGLGLVLAFVIELFLDRSIKRPIEVQTKLKIPFFLSIPDLNQGMPRKALAGPARKLISFNNADAAPNTGVVVRENQLEVMAWEVNRRFDSYYDALRDRLVVYFESINLTRKPKLVAVTSTHKGAGVSTIAAGLAQSLSETGDGRVLLVDMNLENGAAQQFFKGKPNCKLDDALESETRDGARVQENLYVVTEDTVTDRLPRVLPKRFASLIPKLKASDYDYIIFDMPPVSPTSVTARLSGFMDTVMLVIESEKTDQQVVQQANALLAQSKANVTAVLNKTRTYIPKRLHQDFLSEI